MYNIILPDLHKNSSNLHLFCFYLTIIQQDQDCIVTKSSFKTAYSSVNNQTILILHRNRFSNIEACIKWWISLLDASTQRSSPKISPNRFGSQVSIDLGSALCCFHQFNTLRKSLSSTRKSSCLRINALFHLHTVFSQIQRVSVFSYTSC